VGWDEKGVIETDMRPRYGVFEISAVSYKVIILEHPPLRRRAIAVYMEAKEVITRRGSYAAF